MLVKLWLIFSWGSIATYLPLPLFLPVSFTWRTGAKAINEPTIFYNPNKPSNGHYTQNYPREIPPVGYIYITIFLSSDPFRIQNSSFWWINTRTSTKFLSLFYRYSVLVSEQTSSTGRVSSRKTSRSPGLRLTSGVGQAAVGLIVLTRGPLELA